MFKVELNAVTSLVLDRNHSTLFIFILHEQYAITFSGVLLEIISLECVYT